MRFPDCFPIFIVGSPRSGTSLLQLMINAHPNISISGETHFFDQIMEIEKYVPSLKDPNSFEEFFSMLWKIHDIQYFPDADKIFLNVKRAMASNSGRTYELFYKELLEQVAKEKGANRFGEKTPTNIRYLNRIIQIFPNAQIIHIIRDPRAAVSSRITMPWASNDIVTNTIKWKLDVQWGVDFSKTNRSYYELRYEDLASDPEPQLRNICEFIGEPYHPKMLEFHKTPKRFANDTSWMEGTYQKVYKSAVNKWENELSEAQVYLIEKMTYPLLIQFRYEPSEIRLGVKLLSPFVFLIELLKYLKFKVKETYERSRLKEGTLFWGESRSLYKRFFKYLFKRTS